MSIRIDPEFQSLIPPLTSEEYKQLEENVVKEGIRDPLVVWPQGDGNDILVDGHNRWVISVNHGGIRFQIVRKDFSDRNEAKAWIIKNQFGRRNLSAYDRSLLALELKPVIAEKAKEKQGTRTDICQKSDKSIDTKKELANIAGVSHDTIHKVEAIEKKATPQTKQLVREGKLSINQAYNSVNEKRKDPVKQAKKEHEEYQAKKQESIVGFEEAQIDKINQEILNNALLQDVLTLLNRVDDFGMKYKDKDLEGLQDNIPNDEKEMIINRCESCKRVITTIMMHLV